MPGGDPIPPTGKPRRRWLTIAGGGSPSRRRGEVEATRRRRSRSALGELPPLRLPRVPHGRDRRGEGGRHGRRGVVPSLPNRGPEPGEELPVAVESRGRSRAAAEGGRGERPRATDQGARARARWNPVREAFPSDGSEAASGRAPPAEAEARRVSRPCSDDGEASGPPHGYEQQGVDRRTRRRCGGLWRRRAIDKHIYTGHERHTNLRRPRRASAGGNLQRSVAEQTPTVCGHLVTGKNKRVLVQ